MEHTKDTIEARVKLIMEETKGKKINVINRIAHEFGVDKSEYSIFMGTEELIKTTIRYADRNSSFASELDNEILQYIN